MASSGGSGAGAVTLYRWSPAWSLTSSNPACIQVEAYLRMSGAAFSVEDCTTEEASPTGSLPAITVGAEAPPSSLLEHDVGGFKSATLIMDHLASVSATSLDARLSASQRAQSMAFTSLLRSTLEPALSYATWLEHKSFFGHTRPIYSRGLPWPLNWVVPWSYRRSIAKSLRGKDPGALMDSAVSTLGALDTFLAAGSAKTGGKYLFGAAPSSLDARLAGALLYLRGSPSSAPVLRNKLETSRALVGFVDYVAANHFGCSAAIAPVDREGWSQAASTGGQTEEAAKTKSETEEAARMRANGKIWLACAGAAMLAYAVFGGHYVEFATVELEEDEDD